MHTQYDQSLKSLLDETRAFVIMGKSYVNHVLAEFIHHFYQTGHPQSQPASSLSRVAGASPLRPSEALSNHDVVDFVEPLDASRSDL